MSAGRAWQLGSRGVELSATNWRGAAVAMLCASVSACSGAGAGASSASSGGKSSTLPLVVNLQATPVPAWLNAAVTFTVTCQSVVGNTNLGYLWTFGDGTTETTVKATDVHTYTAGGSFTYSVTCTDGTQSSQITAMQPLTVLPYDLNVVAAGTCSTGLQGLGWCWQRPLPTGANLKAVAAITPLSAWAVGDFGTVLETNDGGINWVPRFPTTVSSYLAIYTKDHNTVALTASDGSVWTSADAGQTWTSTAPAAGAYTLTQVSMADPNDIWGINDGAGIVHTSNGGNTWAAVAIAPALAAGTQLNAISAGSDAKAVWAVGNAPADGQTIGAAISVFTADGMNWTAAAPPSGLSGLSLNTVSVTATSKCLAGAPASDSVWIAGAPPGGVAVANALPVGGVSAESLDGGSTWSLSTLSGGSLLSAFDADTAWQTLPYTAMVALYSANNGFGVTTMGNSNTGWTFPLAAQVGYPTIHGIDSADCHNGFAVGDRGTILMTTNAGSSWTPQAAALMLSTANNLTSMFAVSAAQAFVLAVDNVAVSNGSTKSPGFYTTTTYQVFSTSDGGESWDPDVPAVNSMEFNLSGAVNPAPLPELTHGQIAGNANGDIVAAGPGFQATRSATTLLWSFHSTSLNDQAAYILSPEVSNKVTSWGKNQASGTEVIVDNISPDEAYEVWKAVAVTNQSAWVIDGLGDVLEQPTPVHPAGAKNGGWTLVARAASLPPQPGTQPPPAGGNAVAAIDINGNVAAVIVGTGGLISRTVAPTGATNTGATWTPITSNETADLNAIAVVSDGPSAGLGWAVGASGTILRTTDAGATWAAQTWSDPTISATNVNLMAVSTADGQFARVVGAQTNCSNDCSVLIQTTDGGASWTRQETGATGLNYAATVDANTGWLVGLNSEILKTVTGGIAPPH